MLKSIEYVMTKQPWQKWNKGSKKFEAGSVKNEPNRKNESVLFSQRIKYLFLFANAMYIKVI